MVNGYNTMQMWGNPNTSTNDLLTSLGSYGTQGFGGQFDASAAATPGKMAYSPSMWDQMLGYTGEDNIQHNGWGGAALGLLQGGLGAWAGMKQYGLAQEQLEESKRQFDLNYQNQRKLTNTRLEDRQRARVASNPNAYRSVGDYMSENGV